MRSPRGTTMNRAAPVRTNVVQRQHLMREVVEVIIFVVLVFAIVHFALAVFQVNDPTMSPALKPGQHVAVNQAAYWFGSPTRGDVVLMNDPHSPQNVILRRVIGVPGDTITLTATNVAVNGMTLTEPYAQIPSDVPPNTTIGSCTLQKDQYYVLGDTRKIRDDSRLFGFVPRSNITGKVAAVYLPLNQFHLISDYAPVFAKVPSTYPKTTTVCSGSGE